MINKLWKASLTILAKKLLYIQDEFRVFTACKKELLKTTKN